MSIETMLPDAEKRGISINLDCPAPLMIKADKVEMDIVFNNLVSNAVKYNRDNGKVDINISEDEGKFTIRVKDTGIGLSKEEAAKLFNEFVRIKNKNTKNILGSGLGLSTVKKIAIIYGGDATVDSVPEQGSTFTVTLMNKAENA
jgi:signal transduction histidine kinase